MLGQDGHGGSGVRRLAGGRSRGHPASGDPELADSFEMKALGPVRQAPKLVVPVNAPVVRMRCTDDTISFGALPCLTWTAIPTRILKDLLRSAEQRTSAKTAGGQLGQKTHQRSLQPMIYWVIHYRQIQSTDSLACGVPWAG